MSNSTSPDGTKGVDYLGGYEYKNGIKIYGVNLLGMRLTIRPQSGSHIRKKLGIKKVKELQEIIKVVDIK